MKKLRLIDLKQTNSVTYEGAAAYSYVGAQPLLHLTFTFGSALFTDGYYEREQQQVKRFAEALLAAWRADPKFAWQYGAWMRDPVRGKGNRIQGSLVPAILDALTDETEHNEVYVARCLGHRPDDVCAFIEHYANLRMGSMTASAKRGVAKALAGFDEYQLMKYAGRKRDVRLCDAVMIVREELEALGDEGRLALDVGRYLHASSSRRAEHLERLPMTRARRALWRQPKGFATSSEFKGLVREARVTWEQVLGHFGTTSDGASRQERSRNRAIWESLLATKGLMGDLAFLRNVRNMDRAGVKPAKLVKEARARRFAEVWPHQVYAAYTAVPRRQDVLDVVFARAAEKLPSGRHLGIADASASMTWVKVGGAFSSITPMDAAFCLTGLMSETSGLGASFNSGGTCLHMAERRRRESALAFTKRPELRQGMGGTQVFGAVMELIAYLRQNDRVTPPDCLWFFSDMQFHPAARLGDLRQVPRALRAELDRLDVDLSRPPLELAVEIYRALVGHVDVVLWNLAAYAPAPVPANMPGVLLVSGFDTNTFAQVEAWRTGANAPATRETPAAQANEVVLDVIRSF